MKRKVTSSNQTFLLAGEANVLPKGGLGLSMTYLAICVRLKLDWWLFKSHDDL